MTKLQDKKGFSLAELLIVVGIIAVLMAIIVPAMTIEINNAKVNTDHHNMRVTYSIMKAAESTGIIEYINEEGNLVMEPIVLNQESINPYLYVLNKDGSLSGGKIGNKIEPYAT